MPCECAVASIASIFILTYDEIAGMRTEFTSHSTREKIEIPNGINFSSTQLSAHTLCLSVLQYKRCYYVEICVCVCACICDSECGVGCVFNAKHVRTGVEIASTPAFIAKHRQFTLNIWIAKLMFHRNNNNKTLQYCFIYCAGSSSIVKEMGCWKSKHHITKQQQQQ